MDADATDDLRRAIDTLPGLVWSATTDGAVDFLNQRWCDYSGISVDEGRGWGWLHAVHQEDRPHLLGYWRSLLDSGESGEAEARLRRADGTFRWFLIRVVPLRGDDGAVIKWYGENIDIEDRKRARLLLAGEKQLLEMVASGCGLLELLDAVCSFVEKTDDRCQCSVLLIDERGATVRHGAAPTLPATFTRAVDGQSTASPYWGPCAAAACQKSQVVVADIATDPQWRDCEWGELALTHGFRSCWTTPILSKGGDAFGTFAVYRREPGLPTPLHHELIERLAHIASIAIERGRIAAELRRSRAHLAEAQRLSSTGSFTWRVSSGEILWSEQAYRIYEFAPGLPVTFDAVFTRIHPDEAAWFQALLERASSQEKDLEFEHRLLFPDRSVKHLHVVAHATRDRDGQLEYVGAVQDVTDRRRAEDALSTLRSELAHISRVTTLGALTASIAHEVNQPLSGIITNTTASQLMLSDEPPNIAGALASAERTLRDANRAAQVISRLRALFKKTVSAGETFDLNEATREVLALTRRELERGRVTVHTELGADLSPIAGDRVQIQQVVLNLVLNAIEAMGVCDAHPRQMVIQTEHDRSQDAVRLLVRDTGCGFDPANERRLFHTFYTTKADGMGIGLSISRSIIEHHQGSIWATRNADAGSTFGFSVPRVSTLGRVRNSDDPPETDATPDNRIETPA